MPINMNLYLPVTALTFSSPQWSSEAPLISLHWQLLHTLDGINNFLFHPIFTKPFLKKSDCALYLRACCRKFLIELQKISCTFFSVAFLLRLNSTFGLSVPGGDDLRESSKKFQNSPPTFQRLAQSKHAYPFFPLIYHIPDFYPLSFVRSSWRSF